MLYLMQNLISDEHIAQIQPGFVQDTKEKEEKNQTRKGQLKTTTGRANDKFLT